MSSPLLTTKLYVPPVREELVRRPRLIEQLGRGLDRKLTLISAPAGFGKTTLLSEWIHSGAKANPPLRTAWLSLDKDDDDLARFLTYLVAAVQTLEPGLGDGLLSAFQTPQQPPVRAMLTALINDIADSQEPFVLVLDDYHGIEAQPIHDAVAFLLDHMPAPMHLVIATRADPPLPVGRLRGRGQLVELRASDLRFTPAEAAAFLNQIMGLGLSPEDISALETRTEGWIAGLQLAALSMERRRQSGGTQDIPSFVQAFAGDDRYIVDYLVEEVFEGQPERIQTFLLKTSILSRLGGPLCSAVTGEADSQATLEALERTNLFLVPLDQKRVWYRYHQLFADLLRQRLQEIRPEWVPELHRRASDWHEQHGLAAEAIGHALAARDFTRAALLIEQSSWAMSNPGDMTMRLAWLDALPDDLVRSRPWLCLSYAWTLFFFMQLDAIEPRLQDAERAIGTYPAAAEGDVPSSSLDQAGVAGLLGEIATLRATVASIRGDVLRSIDFSHEALACLPEGNASLRGIVSNVLGTAYEANGDMEAAIQAFAESAALCRLAGNAVVALIAMGNLGRLQEAQGQLRLAEDTHRRALQYATEQENGPLPVAGMAHVGLGALLCEWNNLDKATRHLQEGIRLGQQMANVELQTVGYSTLAQVRQAQGDVEGALEAIGRAEQFVQGYNVSVGAVTHMQAYRARLWIVQGRLDMAASWLQESGLRVDDKPSYQRESEQLSLARLLLAQGRLAQAIEALERLLHTAESQGRMGDGIGILVLLALAWQAQGVTDRAVATLARALSLAEPEGYVRTFLDEGPVMERLLQRALSQGIAPGYASRLLAVVGETAKDQRTEVGDRSLVEPLSERELGILRWIAAGLSNREIAEELVITVGTVKWHTNNIYGKLRVKRRTEAVARARDLGLL